MQDADRRTEIKTVLDLDNESGQLRRYVARLCADLGIGMHEIYATNACKNFFTDPPTSIMDRDRVDARESAHLWLPYWVEKLSTFQTLR